MEKIIVAFEGEKSRERIREVLESSGTAACLVCRSAAEVKRLVRKQHITAVVSGFKFPDDSAESLFDDLPVFCSMLLLAVQSQLDMCENEDIFKLATPVSKGDLIASVRMLLQMSHRLEKYARPRRSEEEQTLISQAKALLMDRHGMTEEQAHRFLQKKSMDSGDKLTDTARMILEYS